MPARRRVTTILPLTRRVSCTLTTMINTPDAGPIYLDEHGVFTTADAVGTLAKLRGKG